MSNSITVSGAEIVNQNITRRRLFPTDFNASTVDRQYTLDYVKGCIVDFIEDILCASELSAEIKDVQIRGFEAQEISNTASATAEVDLVFTAESGTSLVCSVYTPIYKGEMYRPSVMSIEGKKAPFAAYLIMELLKKRETIKPEAAGMFRDRHVLTHEKNTDNNGKGPFSQKPTTMLYPYFEPSPRL